MPIRTAPLRGLLAALSLLAVAACTNATPTTTGSAAPAATRMAGNPSSGSNSVAAVSDALGQRLDGMLNTRQASSH
jgi:hypothetical protein